MGRGGGELLPLTPPSGPPPGRDRAALRIRETPLPLAGRDVPGSGSLSAAVLALSYPVPSRLQRAQPAGAPGAEPRLCPIRAKEPALFSLGRELPGVRVRRGLGAACQLDAHAQGIWRGPGVAGQGQSRPVQLGAGRAPVLGVTLPAWEQVSSAGPFCPLCIPRHHPAFPRQRPPLSLKMPVSVSSFSPCVSGRQGLRGASSWHGGVGGITMQPGVPKAAAPKASPHPSSAASDPWTGTMSPRAPALAPLPCWVRLGPA